MATASSEVSNNDESTSSHPSTAKSNASSEKTRNPQSPHPEAELSNTVVAEHGRLLILDPAEIMVGECFNRSEETYDSDSFDQLLLSILKNKGNLEPITVYQGNEDGKFVLVSGERRLRACRVNRLKVYALVIEKPHSGEFEIDGLIKNTNRESLSPYELGKQVLFVLENHKGVTLGNLALEVGIDKSNLSRACELARLPAEIVSAFAAPGDMRFADGKTIREALTKNTPAVIEEAKLIAAQKTKLKPAEVISRLQAAADKAGKPEAEGDENEEEKEGVAPCNTPRDSAMHIDGKHVADIDAGRKGLVKIAMKVPLNERQQKALRTQIEAFIRKRVLSGEAQSKKQKPTLESAEGQESSVEAATVAKAK
jgi:ParB/RepB/Spo0J family partition protein